MTTKDPAILLFVSAESWEAWLEKHHTQEQGIWLRFAKKNTALQSITYREALDVALCYGWIDSQAKSYDEQSYLQKFSPRRTKSVWSKINTEHAKRLIMLGKMKPAGLEQIERAKKDGRWDAAYDSPTKSTVPADFLQRLKKDEKAFTFFKTLNKTNVYAITWRLQTAKKPETREKRIETILAMLAKGEKFH